MRRVWWMAAWMTASLWSGSALGEESWSYQTFLAGDTPGDPSTEKRATLYSLYATAGVSVVVGGVFLSTWGLRQSAREEFVQEHPGACADQASAECSELRERDRDASGALGLGVAGLSTGALLLASGVVLARHWSNAPVAPELGISTEGGFAGARFHF